VLTNDKDADGDKLTVTQFTIPGIGIFSAGKTAVIPGVGTLVIRPDGSYVFTPSNGYSGPVPNVIYTISDGIDTDTGVLSFAAVPSVPDFFDNGSHIMLSNPTPSLFPTDTSGLYSLPQFRTFEPLWGGNRPYSPSQLSLIRGLEECDMYLKASLRDQVVIELHGYNFSVPEEAFCHCNINEELDYKATRVDGTPLPDWLHFDPKQLKFSGVPPKGAHDEEVMVTATDRYGNEVHATFKVKVKPDRINGEKQKNVIKNKNDNITFNSQNTFETNKIEDELMVIGKVAFNEQLNSVGKMSRLSESRALLDSLKRI
jgi:hypothetical protein